MNNYKDDNYYIEKMIADIEFVLNHTNNISLQQLQENEVLLDSVLFRLIQISESSLKISDTKKDKTPNIPWFSIRGLRNRIVHDYGNVDLSVVYDTITVDMPKLLDDLKSI